MSDSVPPLVVADSIQVLMKYPPQAVVPTIRTWTAAQYRGGAGSTVPISDYLFHALKKIHMMGEFRLVPREPLDAYLATLKPAVLPMCPEEDRANLMENLSHLGEQASTSVSAVQTIYHQSQGESAPRATRTRSAPSGGEAGGGAPAPSGGGAAAESGGSQAEALQGFRRFSLLLERLEASGALRAAPGAASAGGLGVVPVGAPGAASSEGVPVAPAAPPPSPAAVEALAFAARSSHSARELDEYLERLKSMGVQAGTDNVFRALAQTLPGWTVPIYSGAVAPVPETGALGAMRRIITEAEDPAEGAKRFQEMVKAGIDRFNEGSLPQAVQMFELADRLVAERRVDSGNAEIVRRKFGETLGFEPLRKASEKPEQHALLRKVLNFFNDYMPKGLLEELPREQKRDRRRLLLALLEVHGAPARAAAYEALSRTPATAVGEEEWFFRRNLLYVIRRVPRTPEASFDDESEVVMRHAQLGLPLLVVKEAVTALGQYKDELTEQGLGDMVRQLEELLSQPDGAPYEAKDMRGLLDRVAATLARLPSSRARSVVIEHAGRKQTSLGDAMARLAELGTQNLSEDAETVDQLLALLKANMPFKLLGMTLKQNDQNLIHVIEALSGTPSPTVRRALQDVATRFRGQEAGRLASRSLAAFDKPAPPVAPPAAASTGEFPAVTPAAIAAAAEAAPAASLQGDLEVFGLPALLQSLADSTASGMLTLREPKSGTAFAMLTLREGKLEEIQRGRLRDAEAFYQLLERPTPGQFAFVKGAPAAKAGAVTREILPLTLEAMRRYDEFQEAAAVLPDAAALESTGEKPTAHPGEKDGSFLQALWERASQGGTPKDIEDALAWDSYRIRRVLVHWVEQGALKTK
ncbi:MAG TPA: DUF4388 domain-containing protein, partial [Thermoanaerobaculia bacterium]|nr:DUF4388 domain-containing protein [Thermoanaerobaculia bacterium]